MTLPICDKDNDGHVLVHEGETLRCKRGQWIRLTDGVMVRDDRPEGKEDGGTTPVPVV